MAGCISFELMSSSCSAPPPHRLLHIVNALNNHRNITALSLASEMEVGERTIKRYISYMRQELGMDIIWEPTSHSYYCEKPWEYIPLMRVSGEEALSLALASKTFAAWQGTALGKALDSILAKVGQAIGGSVSVPVSEIQSFLSTPAVGHEGDREHTWFAPLLEAIRLKRELKICYKKPTAKRSERRILWPLHLAYLDHHWALVFWDKSKKQPRKFLLNRIESIERTGGKFVDPKGFDIEDYLKNSFGLYTGEEVFGIKIQFDEVAAAFLRERKWHPSQAIEEQTKGGLIASFQVNHLMDIQRWVLSWGGHAEVLEPKDLRESIKTELSNLNKIYS